MGEVTIIIMISLVLYYLSLIINKLEDFEDFEDFIEDYEKLKLQVEQLEQEIKVLQEVGKK